jgi:hypothetical protein
MVKNGNKDFFKFYKYKNTHDYSIRILFYMIFIG